MDPASDDFYRQHMYSNYGEVGLDVKEMVDKFAAASQQHKQVRGFDQARSSPQTDCLQYHCPAGVGTLPAVQPV